MIEGTQIFQINVLDRYNKVLNVFNSTVIFQTSVIVEEILKEVKPISIYLIGSFGRNEGSFYLSGEAITPLRDYDVLIVVNKRVREDVIKKIRRNIHNRLGLPDPFFREFKFKGFTVWITQVTLKDINALPMLKFYELKMASKLLWGRDMRDSIHLSFEDISAYNGVLILFSKVEGLLGLLDVDILKRNKNSKETIDFVYECMKTYVEIGTCLSLLAKMYEPSFLGRCIRLFKNFKILFPELEKMNTALPSLIVTCAYRRLIIDDDSLNDIDFGKLLCETLKDLKIALWYYLRKAYRANIMWSPSYANVFDDYVKKLDTKVLEDLFDFFLSRKLGLWSKVGRELVVNAYIRFTLLKFFIAARKRGYQVRPQVLFTRHGNVMLRLWLSGFALLESIREDLTVDEAALDVAVNRLSELIGSGSLPKGSGELRFYRVQKLVLALLDLSDKLFHRKD
jgi:predicted nucleotidyltransferase